MDALERGVDSRNCMYYDATVLKELRALRLYNFLLLKCNSPLEDSL